VVEAVLTSARAVKTNPANSAAIREPTPGISMNSSRVPVFKLIGTNRLAVKFARLRCSELLIQQEFVEFDDALERALLGQALDDRGCHARQLQQFALANGIGIRQSRGSGRALREHRNCRDRPKHQSSNERTHCSAQ
jgi:hypothetical protein